MVFISLVICNLNFNIKFKGAGGRGLGEAVSAEALR
jgi:hypothetical protein